MRLPPNNLGSKVVIQKIRSKRHYSDKIQLRKILIKKRKLFNLNAQDSSNNIANNLIKYLNYMNFSLNNKNISFYWPIGSEIDTRPSMAALNDFGSLISLASTEKNNIIYRLWMPDDLIKINKMGIQIDTQEVNKPDIIICPLIGFDKNLNRLGRGGGYYDKSLLKLNNTIKIGFAYSIQEIDKVPMEKHDINMDAIITDKFIYAKN
jgi:5-formyltetrahydrofolate cyclo-ligase